MPAFARLLLALGTLTVGWYTLFVSLVLSGEPVGRRDDCVDARRRLSRHVERLRRPADAELAALLERAARR